MNRVFKRLLLVVIVILLGFTYTIASTYAVIINVTSDNGINKIINRITIEDLVTNDNGNYNNTYYNVKNSLNITEHEADILINSNELDKVLQIVLKSVVDYKVNDDNTARLSDNEIFDMIETSINNDDSIPGELKNKVIDNSYKYITDVSDFLYDLDVSVIGNRKWYILF